MFIAILSNRACADSSDSSVNTTTIVVTDSVVLRDTTGHSPFPARQLSTGHDDSAAVPELAAITVTADKRQRMMETAQSFSVIHSDEWTGSGKSVADIIAGQAGVQTRRYGGTGSFQTVSVRGVRGSEVLVLLDGIPLNSAMGGPVDLGKINPALLGEIEVYRGVTPGQFGGNSIGGVINLKSSSSTQTNMIDGHAAVGNYGTHSYALNTAFGGNHRLHMFAAGALLRSENDFPYDNRNNTIYNDRDDTVCFLENARYSSANFRLQPSYQLSTVRRLIGSFSADFIDQQLPAPEGKRNRTARYSEQRQTAWLLLADENGETRSGFVPRIGYTRSTAQTVATPLDEGFGASHGGSDYSEYGFIDQLLSADLQCRLLPFDCLSAVPVVNFSFEDGDPSSVSDGFGHGDWHSREAQLGASCALRYNHGPAALTANMSLRGVYSSTNGGYDTDSIRMVPPGDTITAIWAATGGAAFKPHDAVLLFVNAGRYSNPPALRERYGARGALLPNIHLEPETGKTAEAGIKLNLGNYYLECAGFHTRSRNTIIIMRSGYLSKPMNCEGANISGIELSAHAEPLKFFSIDIRCTAQHTKNLTRDPPWYGNRLPDEPAFNSSIECKFFPLPSLTFGYRLEFKSIYFHDHANTDAFRVPAVTGNAASAIGSFFHHASASWHISRNISLLLTGNNLNASLFPTYPITTIESGYSWVLYPSNEVRFTMKYSF